MTTWPNVHVISISGLRGIPGTTGTIDVLPPITTAAGTSPGVENEGNATHAELRFYLPASGAPGVGVAVETIGALRNVGTTDAERLEISVVTTLGCNAAGDGGGGTWRFVATDPATDNTGTIAAPAVGATTGRWRRVDASLVNVRWFGATGDGVTNDTPAIQAAVDTGFPVFVPHGTYYLATPIKVSSGNMIFGVNGQPTVFAPGGSNFKPATCAIQTSNYDSQQVFFSLHDIGFIGGTVQVDLGLFHEIDIRNCSFYSPSVGAFVCVRGEKQHISRIRVDAVNHGIFGLSLGRWEDSLNAAPAGTYNSAYFAPDGAWFDRATIQDIALQGGGAGYFTYGLHSNILSGSTISNFIEHGNGNGTNVTAVMYINRLQQSAIIDSAPDAIAGVSTPAAYAYYFGTLLNSTLINVSPAFAGNSYYTKGIAVDLSVESTCISCYALGDNVSTYGFYFGAAVGQTGTLVQCRGSFYSASGNTLIRNQLSQIGCDFFGANNATNGRSLRVNASMIDQLMADSNGATASSGSWGVRFASGGGGSTEPFLVDKDFVNANAPIKLHSVFGSTYGPTIQTHNASPEGAITAPPGSLCLTYSGTSSGKLYVKESGTGATGWVVM